MEQFVLLHMHLLIYRYYTLYQLQQLFSVRLCERMHKYNELKGMGLKPLFQGTTQAFSERSEEN
jgi:hypothetical protein